MIRYFYLYLHLGLYFFELKLEMANNNDSLENRLRNALQRNVTELNNYRDLYRQLQAEHTQLRQTSALLQNENSVLFDQLTNLNELLDLCQNEVLELKAKLSEYDIKPVRKLFSSMKSRSQRALRKKQYRKVLHHLLHKLPDVISANVNLNVGTQWMDIRFSDDDLNSQSTFGSSTQITEAVNLEHNYSIDPSKYHSAELVDSDVKHDDLDGLIVSGGKMSKRHVRSICYVMDKFKIAQNAYHELRMSCNGLLPTLCSIRKERLQMSQEIPYILDPYVSWLKNIFCPFL